MTRPVRKSLRGRHHAKKSRWRRGGTILHIFETLTLTNLRFAFHPRKVKTVQQIIDPSKPVVQYSSTKAVCGKLASWQAQTQPRNADDIRLKTLNPSAYGRSAAPPTQYDEYGTSTPITGRRHGAAGLYPTSTVTNKHGFHWISQPMPSLAELMGCTSAH
jgi:hypothetical protein